jgi:hypothetical protein
MQTWGFFWRHSLVSAYCLFGEDKSEKRDAKEHGRGHHDDLVSKLAELRRIGRGLQLQSQLELQLPFLFALAVHRQVGGWLLPFPFPQISTNLLKLCHCSLINLDNFLCDSEVGVID